MGYPQLRDNVNQDDWSTLSSDQEWNEEAEQALRELYESNFFEPNDDEALGAFDDTDYQYPE